MSHCRICNGPTHEFIDFGKQPLSDAFRTPEETTEEFFFRLAVSVCESCSMVQLSEEVPRERMFHEAYPYRSSGSTTMRKHFEDIAQHFLNTELDRPDPFIVEIGSNDGIMLKTIAEAGVRHLGVEPSGEVAEVARGEGVQVRTEFFEYSTASDIAATETRANVIFSANTMCHIPYMESIFQGIDALLTDDGVFVFEDPYLGEIVERTSFDQIYDEHFYFFTAGSVQAMARRFGFELVDVERLPVHGGEVRYTLARPGRRPVSERLISLIAEEEERELSSLKTLTQFADDVHAVREGLVGLLETLRQKGKRVVGYGATAKSATVNNFCRIGPEFVSAVYDTTPGKQGRLTPGTHIPVLPMEEFGSPYPDYALLYAWNHGEEIRAKEKGFADAGGNWILFVPEVREEPASQA